MLNEQHYAFERWAAENDLLTENLSDFEIFRPRPEAAFRMAASNVVPTKDTKQLFRAVKEAIKVAEEHGITSHPLFTKMLLDVRLPGWIKLLIALYVGEVTAIHEQARHVVSLVQIAEGNPIFLRTTPKAFAQLSASRRLRLSLAHIYGQVSIDSTDLEEIFEELPRGFWNEHYQEISTRTNWKNVDFTEAAKPLIKFKHKLPAKAYFSFMSGLASDSEALRTQPQEVVPLLIEALNQLDRSEWPRGSEWSTERISKSSVEAFELAADGTPAGQHLAAMLIGNIYRPFLESPELHRGLIERLASEYSIWVLPELLNTYNSLLLLDALEVVLEKMPEDVQTVNMLVRNLANSDGIFWTKAEILLIWSRLGEHQTTLLKGLGYQIGKWSYPMYPATKEWYDGVPDYFKELLFSLPRIQDEVNALINVRYFPKRTTLIASSGLRSSLAILIKEAADDPELIKAWLQIIPVQEFASLVMGYDRGMPSAILNFLNETLETCPTLEIKRELVSSLRTPAQLGYNHTLKSYAAVLTAAILESDTKA